MFGPRSCAPLSVQAFRSAPDEGTPSDPAATPPALLALNQKLLAVGDVWSSAARRAGAQFSANVEKVAAWSAPLRREVFGGATRDTETLMRERAAAVAAKRAGSRGVRPSAAPPPGSASAAPDGQALHAPAAPRQTGLWTLPTLPTEAESAETAWRTRTREACAARFDGAQAALGEAATAAAAGLRSAHSGASGAAAEEFAAAQVALDNALARSNAAFALRLARCEAAHTAALQAAQTAALDAARTELVAAGVAEPSEEQLRRYALKRLAEAAGPDTRSFAAATAAAAALAARTDLVSPPSPRAAGTDAAAEAAVAAQARVELRRASSGAPRPPVMRPMTAAVPASAMGEAPRRKKTTSSAPKEGE